jgi:hypothetical protein
MPKSFRASIRKRCGRQVRDILVTLEKPVEQYAQSERFEIDIDNRTVPVYVEIPIRPWNSTLYVSGDWVA